VAGYTETTLGTAAGLEQGYVTPEKASCMKGEMVASGQAPHNLTPYFADLALWPDSHDYWFTKKC
jgi:hypothetical protein